MNKNKTYILASGSPRRIEIMRSHCIDPIIHPASIEENIPPENGMCQTVMFLALKKAKAVETEVLDKAVFREGDASVEGDSPIIIAGDTIVYKDEIMGKPENREDAYRMLAKLKNDYHYVVTGCALVEAGIQNARVFAEITKVFVKDLTEAELNAYLDTNEPYDKAGAYAIQGIFSKHIDHIEGDYDNVVGFPWSSIEKELELL